MKSAPFEYVRPHSVDEACDILASDDSARVIAGGQTLVPMMAMRLARPTRLIDINRIAELSFIRDDDDHLVVGAMTRQRSAERNPLVPARLPLLARALPWIGHAATRARGTIGGSIANADPAAEIALLSITIDATINYRAGGADHSVAARDFIVGPMTTALPQDGCLASVSFPIWRGRIGTGFAEVNARRSDFAFAAAAAQIELDAEGRCKRIAIGVGAVADVPFRLAAAESQLIGTTLNAAEVLDAVRAALADVEPMSDPHASPGYRRRAAAELAARAVAEARDDALENSHAH
jgi:carbon-monoxide dehydrogenase medium subunit